MVCLITINQIYHWRWYKSHSNQAQRLFLDTFAIQIGSQVAEPDTFTYDIVPMNCKQDDLKQPEIALLFGLIFETPNERVSIYHEWAGEREYFPEYLQRATKSGNGFNKIMRTGNGFNTVIMYILPSKQERKILFEATKTCLWLKLDVCSMRVRFAPGFATQQRDTIG